MIPDAIVVGGFTVDIVHAANGTTSGRQIGGSGVYAAVGVQVWDLRPGLVGIRGTGLPEDWRELLLEQGVMLDGVVPVDLPAPVNEFFYQSDGSRMQRTWTPSGDKPLVHYLPENTGEPIRRIALESKDVPSHYWQARGAHLTPLRYPVQSAMVPPLSRLGLLTLDPYPYVTAKCTDAQMKELLRPITAFLPSHQEVSSRFPNTDAKEAAVAFSELSANIVVVKQGTLGSLMYLAERRQFLTIPSFPVAVKDPTGAGDAFCGGFLAGMIQTRDPLHAAVCGTVSASFVVEDFWFRGAVDLDIAERDRRYAFVRERVR